jgi:hypothetical protein
MASLTDTQIQLINIISNALFQKPLKIQETIFAGGFATSVFHDRTINT